MSRIILALSLLLVALAGAPPPARAETPLETLSFVTESGTHAFKVEVADSNESRRVGLMYRRSLGDDRGMLFDFGSPQPISMWMQNTYVSLDMVFVAADGRVQRIETRAEPLSTRIIESGGPVRFVVELVGGAAAKIGLKRGDRVTHRLIGD